VVTTLRVSAIFCIIHWNSAIIHHEGLGKTLSTNKNQKLEIIARQLSQLAREAQRELINELIQERCEYLSRNKGSDIRLHIISLHQKRRDKCISASESIAENYLNNCNSLSINHADGISILKQTLDDFIDDTYNSLKKYVPIPNEQFSSEAEGMMRPTLERRIPEIIENAKDGFCRGKFYTTDKGERFLINAMEVTMGDKYENIYGSTILSRSLVEKSFNNVKSVFDEGIADALKKIANEIERSNNKDAAENFDSFIEELQKPEPKKAVLRALWSGLTSILPTITQMTDVATKIDKLLS
jgi:hypothetical protein